MSTTQYIVLGIFIIFAIGGVVIFAGFGGFAGNSSNTINVSVWGTVPAPVIDKIVESINAQVPDTIRVEYTEKDAANLSSDLVEALAEGYGPDLFIIPHTLLLKEQGKLALVPWSVLSERTFKDTFIEGGEVFTTSAGVLALPFVVDPLVMYWNRDIFTSKNFVNPPKLWEEASSIGKTVSDITQSKIVKKSGLALGEYQNINHAKEILLTLAMQAGSGLIKRDPSGEFLENHIMDTAPGLQSSPFEDAVSFYTEFANPASERYSWNRSLPSSDSMFLKGSLAMYIGFASEYSSLRERNPNLNFDVATIPQATDGETNKTYADIYGLAILKNSKNTQNAYNAALLLTNKSSIEIVSDSLALPPVRRDLLSTFPGTSYGDIFYQSALWAKSPLDPSPNTTEVFVKNMIESITSGSETSKDALLEFSQQIDEILRK